ncbi:O-antigen ligase family protein [Yeosuana sp. MJ-SS3]|uniref:O-antigen ligase family protein n=1 Tax=Gilvirhabdus luticola TaxID=3079858 RepID=A0ABU3U6V8_9FLAO|nr:O-antigen ligase family protein [Yeosuana sp. MJ-SS3]MDU8886144.1 O-antigen ligase family protein [Yeosuana sp. MJ-SS3]
MQIFKYILLTLVLLSLPTFGLYAFGPGVGSALVLLMFIGILGYFFLNKKEKFVFPFLVLGLSYYLISGVNFSGFLEDYINDIIKYLIFIILTGYLIKQTKQIEVCIILLIGALSILVNVIQFPNSYGRYSGLYLNPNTAGVVCLLGFAYSYSIKSLKYRLLLQFLFTIAGIMTFSRSFILVLILVNLVSMISNKKNIIGLLIGAVALVIILGTTTLQLNSKRFSALKSIFSDDVDREAISENPRNETWALYTDVVLDKPIYGHGYKSMQGKETDTVGIKAGVHNTYLMVLGESGLIPFLLLTYIYVFIFIKSLKHFSAHPEYNYLSIILITYLLVSHNFFDNYLILFISIWLYIKVKESPEIINPITKS